MLRNIATFILLSCMSWAAVAEGQCQLDLHYELILDDNSIRVVNNSHTLYQINNSQQLFVKGRLLALDEDKQELVTEFAEGLHYTVPKMTLLVTEGIDLAIDTMKRVYTSLMGKDTDSVERFQDGLKNVQKRIKSKFNSSGGVHMLGAGSIENMDEFVDKRLEEEFEDVISDSVGGVLTAIGSLMSGEGNLDQRAAILSRRIEDASQDIERSVEPQAQLLKKRARWFCQKLNRLDRIEDKMRQQIPELTNFDLIVSQSN